MSLQQIIMMQEDEPKQKNCIYKLHKTGTNSTDEFRLLGSRSQSKAFQIRVKSIRFQEHEAIAIYFYDVTHHIESF